MSEELNIYASDYFSSEEEIEIPIEDVEKALTKKSEEFDQDLNVDEWVVLDELNTSTGGEGDEVEEAATSEKRLRSVVFKRKHCDAVFASDGVVGALKDRFIKSVIQHDGNLKSLIKKIKSRVKDLNCCILLSVGNNIATIQQMKKKNVVQKFMSILRKFGNEVKVSGGTIIVASLLPRPIETDTTWSKNSLDEQVKISEIYCKLNDEIYNYNKENGIEWPHIKAYLESKTYKDKNGNLRENKMLLKGLKGSLRKQRKMVLENFCPDGIHVNPDIREKIQNVCISRLLEYTNKTE